jgi:ubiquinone/menaquinone biosynthesis C-methylase UbiE
MDYYNSIAKGYDGLHKEEQLRKLKVIQDHLPKNLKTAILDVGCGTGISKILGNVIGIDPSRNLIAQATFPTAEGVAENLPFKDSSFDAVVSVTALHHCTNIAKAIAEIRRVAKGTVILSILKKSKKHPLLKTEIKKQLSVQKIIDDAIDTIFICAK